MRKMQMALLACGAMLLLMGTLALGAPARANGLVHIQDDANVLSAADKQQLTTAAQNAPFAVTVWTNSTYSTKDDFYNAVRGMVGDDMVVLGVDPVHKWSHISAKQNTGLTAAQVDAAANQANAQFGNGAWGAGFASALNNLAAAAPAGGQTSGNTAPAQQPAPAPSGGGGFGLLACLIPIVLIVLAFFFLRNRMGGNRAVRGIAPNQPYTPPQQGGYPPQQGGYPPQQGGYYPPQQGGGIGGNIASGGLGALAGGAIGYELGRNAGQNQGGQGNVQPGGTAPDFGGGGGGIIDSSSGGSGADFGGGGADFGGGASFGGGSGGGADFGGSSGGDTGGGDIV